MTRHNFDVHGGILRQLSYAGSSGEDGGFQPPPRAAAIPEFLIIECMVTFNVTDTFDLDRISEPVIELLPGFVMPRFFGLVGTGEYFERSTCWIDANIDIFGEALDDAEAFG